MCWKEASHTSYTPLLPQGLNNDFLVRSADPLALLYNDISPMENHHLAATFTLLSLDQYNFLNKAPPKVSTPPQSCLCSHSQGGSGLSPWLERPARDAAWTAASLLRLNQAFGWGRRVGGGVAMQWQPSAHTPVPSPCNLPQFKDVLRKLVISMVLATE